jgi:WD40 repeat protein
VGLGNAAWASGESRLATAGEEGRVRLWLGMDGTAGGDLEAGRGWVLGVAWSPDGRHLAAGTQESSVVFWRVGAPSGTPPSQMTGYAAKVTQVAWDASSRYLATAGGSAVTIWDISGEGPEGRTPQELDGHDERVSTWRTRPVRCWCFRERKNP